MTHADNPRPHRPARFADLTELIDAAGGNAAPGAHAEIASATAEVVVRAGRTGDPAADARLVDLAERVGLDTLAELWRTSDPTSLPGALWALYLLRQWCHTGTDEVVQLWRAGEALAPVDAAVAGVADYADGDAIRVVADAVLAGIFHGDLAVALERAAAFFRVVAAGRRVRADNAHDELELAGRNERAAQALSVAASRWRAGTLH